MATQLTNRDISRVLRAVPKLVDLPATRMWLDYDDEADVLYLSFRRPQRATDSEMRDDGVIVHRRGTQVVGLTVLDASSRDTSTSRAAPKSSKNNRS